MKTKNNQQEPSVAQMKTGLEMKTGLDLLLHVQEDTGHRQDL